MESNKFELTGRVNFKDLTYSQKGKAVAKLLVSKRVTKNEEIEYQSYNVTLFGEIAEKTASIEKADLIYITGNLSTSRYEKDGKQIERMQLIGNDFKFIEFDEKKKKYVEVKKNNEESDIPW